MNAPALLADVPSALLLSARVSATLDSTFDAGALVVVVDATHWGKLALERSPAGEATIVSVVTRTRSDDCNSFAVTTDGYWLRIAVMPPAVAFHASADGAAWSLIRHFALGTDAPLRIGLEAQSPLGEGCTATFSDVALEYRRLAELRDGS